MEGECDLTFGYIFIHLLIIQQVIGFYLFRLYAHTLMLYLFTFWTFYVLHEEYKTVSTMRLKYIASEERRPDQFTVSTPSYCLCIHFFFAEMIVFTRKVC